MKRIYLLLIAIWVSQALDAVTLEQCLNSLRQNIPLSANLDRVKAQKEDSDGILQAAYYPSLSLMADFGYNSEVTELSLGSALPIKPPSPDKDRENIGMELRQLIWDSGINSLQKQANAFQSQAKLLDVEAAIHLKELEATLLYYQIVSSNTSLDILRIQKENLLALQKQVEAAKLHGIREHTDVLMVQQDILSLTDKVTTTSNAKMAAIEKLKLLCQMNLDAEESFVLPEITLPESSEIDRAELCKLEAIAAANTINSKVAKHKNYPQIMAKATAGYGKPGYDIFNTDWHDYYSVGVSLSWKIWDFGMRNKESKIASSEAEIAKSNYENLSISLQNEINSIDSELLSLSESIATGTQKVELLQEIVSALNRKHEAGTITTTELLIQSNNLLSARLEVDYNRIKLSALQAKKLYVLGAKI